MLATSAGPFELAPTLGASCVPVIVLLSFVVEVTEVSSRDVELPEDIELVSSAQTAAPNMASDMNAYFMFGWFLLVIIFSGFESKRSVQVANA